MVPLKNKISGFVSAKINEVQNIQLEAKEIIIEQVYDAFDFKIDIPSINLNRIGQSIAAKISTLEEVLSCSLDDNVLKVKVEAKYKYQKLIKALNLNECALMIGPSLGIAKDPDEDNKSLPLLELLSIKLSEELDNAGQYYIVEEKSNLPYISQQYLKIYRTLRTDLEDFTKEFFKNQTDKIPKIYEGLAKLPFKLIINTTPDNLMFAALNKTAKKARQKYYDYSGNNIEDDVEPFDVERPLVYNLFGTVNNLESLVLTERDRVSFVHQVITGQPAIPRNIISTLKDIKYYLFLGFNLEQWHFRLLLKSLEIVDAKTRTFFPKVPKYPPSAITENFFRDEFQFTFINEYNYKSFVNELPELLDRKEKSVKQEQDKILVIHAAEDSVYASDLIKRIDKLGDVIISDFVLDGGDDIVEKIKDKISNNNIILPIVSVEIDRDEKSKIALEMLRRVGSQKKIILIKGRVVPDDMLAVFGDSPLPILPKNGEAIQTWENKDEAYTIIYEELKELLDGFD